MYLKSITINNYRSIQYAQVDFEEGLNILIGKNGVGKSNLLKYINQYVSYFFFNSRSRSVRNPNLEFEYVLSYDDDNKNTEIVVAFKNEKSIVNNEIEFTNDITLSKKVDGSYLYTDKKIQIKSHNSQRKKNAQLDEFLKEMDFFRFFRKAYIMFEMSAELPWLSLPNKYQFDSELYPESNGYFDSLRIVQIFEDLLESQLLFGEEVSFNDIVLDDIKNIFFKTFETFKLEFNLDRWLSYLTPITEIRINPNINIYFADNKILVENLLIDFKVNGAWIPWNYLSDGTKRLFYLITECLGLKNGLLLIEEPELGIHPHQLYALLSFIKEQSLEKQIIISTHSPIVLDILSPEELSKISIVKIGASGTKVFKLNEEQTETAQEYMDKMGDLSYYWLHSDLENE